MKRWKQRGLVMVVDQYGYATAPTTSPFTWDNVVLAMDGEDNYDKSQYEWFFDNTASLNPSTAQFKFGAKSLLINGSGAGQYKNTAHELLGFLGDTTLDFWLYPNNVTGSSLLVEQRTAAGAGWGLDLTAGVLSFIGGAGSLSTGAIVTTNSWQHIRVVRSGSTFYIFYNGALQTSGSGPSVVSTLGSTFGAGAGLEIGGAYNTARQLNGYLDDIIISNEALTTTSFTAPTSSLIGAQPTGFSGWNSSDKGANVTVSAGGRRASLNSSLFGVQSIRGTQGYSTGVHYFEVTLDGGNTVDDSIHLAGLGNSSASLTTFPGGDANGWGFYPDGPQKFNNGSASSYGANVRVFGVLWDATAGEIRFKTSASAPSVAFSGISGTLYPMWGPGSGSGVRSCSINTGATAFKWGLPAGATAWG